MDILWLIGLALACGIGLVAAVLQLPGTWIILVVSIAYGWHDGWKSLGPVILIVLGVMALLGEGVEFMASLWAARRAGASRRASWYGLLGGVVGLFVFSLPLPVIGTVAGGIIGCFVGAMIGEMTVRDDMTGAVQVGVSAAVGRAIGTTAKLAVAFAMIGLALGSAVVAMF